MKKHTKIIIFSGPAGVGKDTIINKLIKNHPNFARPKSYTTREKRISDEFKNRIYIDKNEFKKLIKNNDLLEWNLIHGNYYGRSKKDIEKLIKQNKTIILELDAKGAIDYKKNFPESISIFIDYEKPELFLTRLKKNRPEISEKELQTRYKSMLADKKYKKSFDYTVINKEDELDKTIEQIDKIII